MSNGNIEIISAYDMYKISQNNNDRVRMIEGDEKELLAHSDEIILEINKAIKKIAEKGEVFLRLEDRGEGLLYINCNCSLIEIDEGDYLLEKIKIYYASKGFKTEKFYLWNIPTLDIEWGMILN